MTCARGLALGALWVLSHLVAARAHAVEPTLVIVPEGTPSALVEAITIELQLAGAEVIVQRVPNGADVWADAVELGAHATSAHIVVIDPQGEHTLVRVRTPVARAETRFDGRLSTLHPRALALATAALLETPGELELERERAGVDESARASADRGESLASPSLRLRAPFTSALATPRAATDLAADEPRAIEPPPTRMDREARIGLEIGLAAAGAALLGLPAALIANAAAGNDTTTPYWIYASATAAPIGVGVGVLLGGLLAGGDGNPFWTVAAALAGALVGGAFMALGAAVDRAPADGVDPAFTLIGYIASVALPPTLAIAAFELTAN